MNASRFGKRHMVLAFEIRLQSYIRPIMQTISLLALMEFAGKVLISSLSSKDMICFRFSSPRSDLFRHHTYINLRNLSAVLTPCCFFEFFLLLSTCRVFLFERAIMGQ